ncbi:GNAT family N-acetyltransferase [Marinivivus vitaminiproducens]|uniref:GNAT family N-acetyltransferase n=1 Tax=Marinivivus vitaminiproducens TaxID=3035935 RepID=UPI0027A5C8A3|nr:acetyltransferase [Geminicoccaceae bacterium SCSIO 64248]
MQVLTSFLEMRAAPSAPRASSPDPAYTLERVDWTPDAYRDLYHAVGDPVGWTSRLEMTDGELARLLRDPLFELVVLFRCTVACGFFEIDRRVAGEAELAHFGLTPAAQGLRLAPWMLDAAVRRGWSTPISRLWLHTDACDSPRALGLYQQAGFVVYEETYISYPA